MVNRGQKRLTPASDLHGLLVLGSRHHGGNDLAEGPQAEKSLPTGIAAVGREMQQAPGEHQEACIHTLAGNVLQVKIAAPWAVGKTGKRQCHAPAIKSAVTCLASPRPAPGESEREIPHPGPMRAEAVGAAALWANHMLANLANARHRITKRLPLGNIDVRSCWAASVR
jgi:hypothetical protein